MRRGVGLLVALLLGVGGCTSTEPRIKPPELPEEYNSPPVSDGRYVNPPNYPRETLNKGMARRSDGGAAAGPQGPGIGMRNGPRQNSLGNY